MNANDFPTPVKFSDGCTRWVLSDLEAFEALRLGRPIPPRRSSEDERYLSARQVADRLGTSTSTIWRWVPASSGVA